MINIGYFRDTVHGRRIPTGKPLANLTQSILHMAAADAVRQLQRRGRIDLSQWIPSFVEAAIPMTSVFVRAGQQTRARELLATIEARNKKNKSTALAWPQRRKSLAGPWAGGSTGFANMSVGFDVFNPNITEYIRNSTYNFVKSTLETAATDATKAYHQLRGALTAGLSGGETTQEINRRVYSIFRDPMRAARAGQTEASRSVAGGGYMLAHSTGATTVRWLASADACDVCLSLNGQERKLGEPFLILPRAKPPYNIILHSPAHPHCFCSETYLIEDSANIDSGTIERLRIAAYSPSDVPARFARGERLAASLGRWERR